MILYGTAVSLAAVPYVLFGDKLCEKFRIFLQKSKKRAKKRAENEKKFFKKSGF